MLVYKSESDIASTIQSNDTIAYCVPTVPITHEEVVEVCPAVAAINEKTPNTSDLFPTKSILVSTVLNKNDDYFDPAETWVAKNTIVDKRCNLEHQEEKIIGHITGNWAIAEDGSILADDLPADLLPRKYHVAVSSVIYTNWENPEIQEEIQGLLRRISEGSVFVSMEATFGGFDYLVHRESDVHIVARNEDTAFLSRYLRAYGGPGDYDGYKLGRVLRNIVFCGKGYVSQPANPDSIIFDANDVSFEKISKSSNLPKKVGVYIKCNADSEQETDMSEEKIEALEKANQELRDELARSDVEKFTVEIEELKQQITDANAKVATLEEVKAELEEERNKLAGERDSLVKVVSDLKAAQKRLDRINTLVGGGLSREDAEARADQFGELSDETFKQLAEILLSVNKKEDEKLVCEEEKEDEQVEAETSEAEVEEEDAEASETNVEDSVDETDEVRKSIASYFEETLDMKESE